MPINSVQLYVKGVLDGLVLPLEMGTLAAYIAPPNPGEGTDPSCYVWGSRGNESRSPGAFPRAQHGNLSTGGWKVLNHDLDMWLLWFGSSEDPQVDQQFPTVVDAVLATLRNLQLLDQQDVLVDPTTGQESNLLNFGERMDWEYAPVRATADQRMWRFDARITCSCEEWIRA